MEYIQQRKQDIINQNNARENAKRIPHEYHKGDLVLLRVGTENKYEQPYSGPHTIHQVNSNGTVRISNGVITETVNIRRLQPFKKRSFSTLHGGECSMRCSKRLRNK